MSGVLKSDIYDELLHAQSSHIGEIKGAIQASMQRLQEAHWLASAKRTFVHTVDRDTRESFLECQEAVKSGFASMVRYLRQQEEMMMTELQATLASNVQEINRAASTVDSTIHRIEHQLTEGTTLLHERDPFLFWAKGSLFKELPPLRVPRVDLKLQDTFPDLTTLSIEPYQTPLQHTVQVDMQQFLKSGKPSLLCGNVFHKGFRFQVCYC